MLTEEMFKCLWAKISADGTSWLPLSVHMRDTAGVAECLWKSWLSESTKELIAESVGSRKEDAELLCFIRFLAASHDIGKASPAFQIKASSTDAKVIVDRIRDSGLAIKSKLDVNAIPHATVSMMILEREGLDRSISVIAGGHHGATPSKDEIRERNLRGYVSNTGFEDDSWVAVQKVCFDHALTISGMDPNRLCDINVPSYIQDLLTAIVIISDWVASNERAFPLIPLDEYGVCDDAARGDSGWSRINFPHHDGLVYGEAKSFEEAFGFGPRCFQTVAMDVVRNMTEPGLVVIEAPMGEGKTEAALAISEILASKFGQNGIFFGLPTQATANGVFSRVKSWVENCSGPGRRSLMLAHGGSAFDQEFESMPKMGWDVDGGKENVVVHEWFHGKTALLSDIVVGTVDQVLMAGLKRKHLSMRHLGLAEKVVIIDECHAYDEYMGSYLTKALRWLGVMRVPVIVMSATLPPKRKEEMISAYSGEAYRAEGPGGYPLITCVSAGGTSSASADASGRRSNVAIHRITMGDVIGRISDCTIGGGFVGVIVNTVGHAQRLFTEVREAFPGADVHLIHSAFTSIDRARKEKAVMDALIRKCEPDGRTTIVIGTQVLEQSLDIDFDVMFSEICPIDLLFQRIGRLHRHSNPRPKALTQPSCYIIDSGESSFDPGTESVYGKLQLMNARMLLNDNVRVPDDIPRLVSTAYSPSGMQVPDEIREEYECAKKEMEAKMDKKEKKAEVFQIGSPEKLNNLVGWLDNQREDPDGLYAEATVRDTDGSVEVILVRRTIDGSFVVPSDSSVVLPTDHAPASSVARQLATCRIQMPHRLIAVHGIKKTIDAVVASNKDIIPKAWYDSEWIAGEMVQAMDSDGCFEILGVGMRYDSEMGLNMDE